MNESYQKLWDDAKKYLQLRYDLMRVELLEKTSQIASILLTIIVALLLGIIIFTYLSALLLFLAKNYFWKLYTGFVYCIRHSSNFACLSHRISQTMVFASAHQQF
jgi:hypothetical protein